MLLPLTTEAWTNVPQVRSLSNEPNQARGGEASSLHVAIALRRLSPIVIHSALEPSGTGEATPPGPLTVVFDASEPSRTGALARSLCEIARGVPIEFLVRLSTNEDGLRSELNS